MSLVLFPLVRSPHPAFVHVHHFAQFNQTIVYRLATACNTLPQTSLGPEQIQEAYVKASGVEHHVLTHNWKKVIRRQQSSGVERGEILQR